jgi:hypothetical protein
MNEEDALE